MSLLSSLRRSSVRAEALKKNDMQLRAWRGKVSAQEALLLRELANHVVLQEEAKKADEEKRRACQVVDAALAEFKASRPNPVTEKVAEQKAEATRIKFDEISNWFLINLIRHPRQTIPQARALHKFKIRHTANRFCSFLYATHRKARQSVYGKYVWLKSKFTSSESAMAGFGQNAHVPSTHASVSISVSKLLKRYTLDGVDPKKTNQDIKAAIRRSGHSKKHQQYALEAIDRTITRSTYIEPDTGLNLQQGLLLAWIACHDKALVKETYHLSDAEADDLIKNWEEDIVYALFESRRAYNIEKGKPLGGTSKQSCPYGYFARFFKALDHKHPDIKFEPILGIISEIIQEEALNSYYELGPSQQQQIAVATSSASPTPEQCVLMKTFFDNAKQAARLRIEDRLGEYAELEGELDALLDKIEEVNYPPPEEIMVPPIPAKAEPVLNIPKHLLVPMEQAYDMKWEAWESLEQDFGSRTPEHVGKAVARQFLRMPGAQFTEDDIVIYLLEAKGEKEKALAFAAAKEGRKSNK